MNGREFESLLSIDLSLYRKEAVRNNKYAYYYKSLDLLKVSSIWSK